MQTPHSGQERGAAEQIETFDGSQCTAPTAELQQSPADPAFWQQENRWRRLPYVRAIWAGPYGTTEYLADRDYHAIAYRGDDGRWRAAFGASLRCHAMHSEPATYLWQPGHGESPRVSRATLCDLLERCARHPATAWILTGEDVR